MKKYVMHNSILIVLLLILFILLAIGRDELLNKVRKKYKTR